MWFLVGFLIASRMPVLFSLVEGVWVFVCVRLRPFCGVWFCSLILFFCGPVLGFLRFLCGGFDSGSGRTLAACLTHASRTGSTGLLFGGESGERVSNA